MTHRKIVPVNTGRVKIGSAYTPPPPKVEGDAVHVQRALLRRVPDTGCNQGRLSPDSFAATRRALGLPATPDPEEARWVRIVERAMVAIVFAGMVLAGLLR